MPFHQLDSLRYFTFDILERIPHAVFTRQGGTSPDPWASLNVGGTVGDDPERVIENRKKSFNALNRNFDSVFDVWQVHSRDVLCTDHPRPVGTPHQKADAILTNQPGVTLFMRFADCVPILLWDPFKQVIGLVHAGWQGTVKKVSVATIERMKEQYGCHPENIQAAIGPSIGKHHYPVGDEVADQIRSAFGDLALDLLFQDSNTGQAGFFLDLWTANQLTLSEAGIRNIEICGLCTACNLDDWYSHRAEAGKTGRFGVLIGL